MRRRIPIPNLPGLLGPRLKALASLLFLSWVLGCQSDNHRPFTSPAVPAKTSSASDSGSRDQRVLFNAVSPTNQIRQEWLAAPTNFFNLGPGDAIEIEMLGEPGPPANAFVGPDGKIYYSLLNGTFVWGLTLTETRDLLEKELAKYLRAKPEVALTLTAVSSKRIWILGGVQKPGVYPLATPLTLLEAIAAAGGTGKATVALGGAGPTSAAAGGSETGPLVPAETVISSGSGEEIADLENSFVLREGKLLPIDFSRLLRRGDLSQNIYLHPDDFVYLRPALSKGDIYVLGAVAAPNIIDFREHISLVAAISSVGGPVQYSYPSHVAIVRGSLAHPTIATFDYNQIIKGKALDVSLEPGDIVYVPFSPYRWLEKFAGEILDNFVRTMAINAGQRAVLGPGATPVGVSVPFGGGK